MTAEDVAKPPFEVYPDVWQSLQVYLAMMTQWRSSGFGLIGMDYTALREVWKRLKIKKKHRDGIFEDLRLMEDTALEEMRKQREANEKR